MNSARVAWAYLLFIAVLCIPATPLCAVYALSAALFGRGPALASFAEAFGFTMGVVGGFAGEVAMTVIEQERAGLRGGRKRPPAANVGRGWR